MTKPGGRHVARKRFGQHFLNDAGLIDEIVAAIAPQAQDAVLEIGPGLGALTHPLLRCLPRMTVVELDRDLVARLRDNPQLHVVAADVLTVDFAQLAKDLGLAPGALRVVGNLPYNISSPILFHLLQYVDVVRDQHFMLQKEVVDRMVASPSTAAYGRLSVMLQWRYDMASVLDVPPEAFDPPPQVDSAVVRMVPKAVPPQVDEALLSELVRAAFSQRRKVLRHSLGQWLAQKGVEVEFDWRRRAEEVAVDEYVALAQLVSRGTGRA